MPNNEIEMGGEDRATYEDNLSSKRKVQRTRITQTANKMAKVIEERGSRTFLHMLIKEINHAMEVCVKVNEQLFDQYEEKDEATEQIGKQLEYSEKGANAIDEAMKHLEEREDETPSVKVPPVTVPPVRTPSVRAPAFKPPAQESKTENPWDNIVTLTVNRMKTLQASWKNGRVNNGKSVNQ